MLHISVNVVLHYCSIRPVYGAQHPPLTEPLGSPPKSAGPKSKKLTFEDYNWQTADVWADTPEDFTLLSLDSALKEKAEKEDEGAKVKLG